MLVANLVTLAWFAKIQIRHYAVKKENVRPARARAKESVSSFDALQRPSENVSRWWPGRRNLVCSRDTRSHSSSRDNGLEFFLRNEQAVDQRIVRRERSSMTWC